MTLPVYYFKLKLCVDTGVNISNEFNYIATLVSIFVYFLLLIIKDKILNYLSYIWAFILFLFAIYSLLYYNFIIYLSYKTTFINIIIILI